MEGEVPSTAPRVVAASGGTRDGLPKRRPLGLSHVTIRVGHNHGRREGGRPGGRQSQSAILGRVLKLSRDQGHPVVIHSPFTPEVVTWEGNVLTSGMPLILDDGVTITSAHPGIQRRRNGTGPTGGEARARANARIQCPRGPEEQATRRRPERGRKRRGTDRTRAKGANTVVKTKFIQTFGRKNLFTIITGCTA